MEDRRDHGVDYMTIAERNNLENPHLIFVGQNSLFPKAATTPAPAPTPAPKPVPAPAPAPTPEPTKITVTDVTGRVVYWIVRQARSWSP